MVLMLVDTVLMLLDIVLMLLNMVHINKDVTTLLPFSQPSFLSQSWIRFFAVQFFPVS